MKKRILHIAGLVVILPLACQTVPYSVPKRPDPLTVEYEVFFSGPDHRLDDCLKRELAATYRDHPDGTLFFDEDSKIRVKVPSGAGKEPYHVHTYHRVGEDLVESVSAQGTDGTIDLDLSKFAQPEILVLCSAPMKLSEKGNSARPLLAPYAMSFRLMPRDQAEHLVTIQPFRYEWTNGKAKADLFVQSFNRNDVLLTLLDLDGAAEFLFSDGYFHWRSGDGFMTPRAVVEVSGAKGNVWMRAGTYSVPDGAWSEENPFDLRLAGKELLSFAPSARVQLALPEEKPATTARIEARFEGVKPRSALRLVLTAGYPMGTSEKFGVRVQSHEITTDDHEGSYLVDLSDLDPSNFPMTGFVMHRFVEPWRSVGGRYAPCAPLGRGGDEVATKLPSRILVPRYASHYDSVFWFGAGGGGEDPLKKFLIAYWSAGGGGSGGSPGAGAGGTGVTPNPWDPSSNVLPPPTVISNPGTPGNGPGNDGSGSGSTPGWTTSNPINSPPILWGPPGFCGCFPGGINCARNTNLNPGDEGECAGKCGVNCPANGHCAGGQAQKVTIKFLCNGKKTGCADKPECQDGCKCGTHGFTARMVRGWLFAAAITGCPAGYTIADVGYEGGDSRAPCHQETGIGRGYVQYWGPAWSSVTVWVKLSVTFEPCPKRGPPPEKENPQGPIGENGDRGDGGFGGVIGLPDLGEPGRIVPGALVGYAKVTAPWNPSTDPNIVGRLMDLVGAFRTGLGFTPLPRPMGNIWSIPTNILTRTPDQLTQGGAALAQWRNDFKSSYWGRKEKTALLASIQLRDVLPDTSVYFGGVPIGTFAGGGGVGEPVREGGNGPIR